MRPDPVLQFRLGLAAIGLIVVIALIAAFTPGLLDRRQSATVVLDHVYGLAEGDAVTDEGFVIGRVTRIEPRLRDKFYVVSLRLNPEWQPDLPPEQLGLVINETNPIRPAWLSVVRNVDASEKCPELRSRKIEGSISGTQFLSCGHFPSMVELTMSVLKTTQGVVVNVQSILSAFVPPAPGKDGRYANGSLVPEVTPTTASLKDTLNNVKEISTSLRDLVSDKNQQKVKDILANLTALSKQVNAMTDKVNGLVDKNSKPVELAVADMRYILSVTATQMSAITSDLQATTANLRELSSQLRDDPASPLRPKKLGDPSILTQPR